MTPDPADPRLADPAYLRFAELVAAERYHAAEALATSLLAQRADDWAFWKTQLGYTCFLNERDDAAWFERAPRHFDELAARRPHDANARFWKAYVATIALNAQETAREDLRTVLRQSPRHPYAALVLGGMGGDANEAVRHVAASLAVIPNSVRALRDLARLLDALGRREEARRALAALMAVEPFVETRFGVMNPYANQVLTGAANAGTWTREAEAFLATGRW